MNSSKTSQATSTTTQDQRQVTDNGSIAVNGAGARDVSVTVTPGAAFDLAKHAVDTTNASVLAALQTVAGVSGQAQQIVAANMQPASQNISDTLIKIGIPAVALVLIVGAFK